MTNTPTTNLRTRGPGHLVAISPAPLSSAGRGPGNMRRRWDSRSRSSSTGDLPIAELCDGGGPRRQPDPSPSEGFIVMVQQQAVVEMRPNLRPLRDDTDRLPLPAL